MSRSYKKIPIHKSHDGGKWTKRMASKAVRREPDTPLNGGNYKKIFNSWELNDWVTYWPIEDAIETYYSSPYYLSRFDTLEKFLIYWKKSMLRK